MAKKEPFYAVGGIADKLSIKHNCVVPPYRVTKVFELRLLPDVPRIRGKRAIPESMIPQIEQIMLTRGWLAGEFAHA